MKVNHGFNTNKTTSNNKIFFHVVKLCATVTMVFALKLLGILLFYYKRVYYILTHWCYEWTGK